MVSCIIWKILDMVPVLEKNTYIGIGVYISGDSVDLVPVSSIRMEFSVGLRAGP